MAIRNARVQLLQAYADAITFVLWDIENCGVPHDCDPSSLKERIASYLRARGIRGPVYITAVAADTDRVSAHVAQALRDSRINVRIVGNPAKQASDECIKEYVDSLTQSHPAPANVLMISGDDDFYVMLKGLIDADYNVMLANIGASAGSDLSTLGIGREECRVLLQI